MLPSYSEFVSEVHRVAAEVAGAETPMPITPFPWQNDLVERVIQRGQWPDQIDVPTGMGKTSVLDAAVYVAARSGVGDGSPGRRRIFFIIDRRVVVDEAFEHARRLATALQQASRSPVLTEVLAALAAQGLVPNRSTGDSPLLVERMRGGVTWSWNWMNRPDRLAIVVGTVDQLGSRMFFRGYGLGQRLAPIDAALVGTDSLIVVDEAHLASPLITAVQAARQLDTPADPIGVSAPAMVVMSATQRPSSPHDVLWRHGLTAADYADPVASTRLNADKQIQLISVTGSRRVSDVMADAAMRLADVSHPVAIGVVCNTVALAREVHTLLAANPDLDSVLLTGRVRPADRDLNMAEYLPRFRVGRQDGGRSLVVVATQTIEVGVNADFDGLVSQAAPWSALVQRLGRLNRVGRVASPTSAVVVGDGKESPVYGAAAHVTWQWLATLAPPTEVGPKDQVQLNGVTMPASVAVLASIQAPSGTEIPVPAVPAIGTPQLDAWACTSPRPIADPPLGPYLHGFADQPSEVRIVWRADLGRTLQTMTESVERLPPRAEETIEITMAAFRAWLGGQPPSDVADAPVTAAAATELAEVDPVDGSDHVLLVPVVGDAARLAVPAELYRVKPGDLVVVPAQRGGCDRFGWSPQSRAPVSDLAEVVRLKASSLPATLPMRFTEATLGALRLAGDGDTAADADTLKRWVAESKDAVDADDMESFDALLTEVMDTQLGDAFSARRIGTPILVEPPADQRHAGDKPYVVVTVRVERGRRSTGSSNRISADGGDESVADHDTDSTASSALGMPVALADHLEQVGRRAESIVAALGLRDDLSAAVIAAARWHDVGKLDDRFQLALRGGTADEFATLGEPLAKSGMNPADREAFRRANRLARVPKGFRHEVGSAQAVAQHAAALGVGDVDLLIHLVASHHGHARPLFPAVDDPDSSPVKTVDFGGRSITFDRSSTVDWSQPRRFRLLNQRYGRWGLALLETIVRLADIECSKEGT